MINRNKGVLFGLGVAGNSAGHLQQTGESQAFNELDDPNKPQALFPFYVPQAEDAYLAENPYSSDILQLPDCEQALVQMEPEVALKLSAFYAADGRLTHLKPIAMTLVNDVTYRNAKINKLAQKKNWGSASKGLAEHEINIIDFTAGPQLEALRLCGFHQRDGQWQLCGEDVALTQYSYFYDQLVQWLLDQIQQQQETGLFHNIQALLAQADYPDTLLIAIGATRYSDYGLQHQLLSGDQSAVVLYDSRVYDFDEVQFLLEQQLDTPPQSDDAIIFLRQRVV
ncbi:hypothetical protein GCM10007916_18210 [Psychromonas marina]|uniref:DUF4261 domain-containing protein n=1 Tax=Psychromonas marina TaxID=88364 RepID=A0ABQ6DZZ1_9GAMM|nr:DUF5718 family protein [Psychromonas marina]GLS90754.1 hypothetical protein GCM10007916_18210 [Psychromonas marina]